MENRARRNGGRKIVMVAVIGTRTGVKGLEKYGMTMARRQAFAAPEKRVAANAVRNRPPNSPSRGPVGLMVRQTPNSSNLKCFIIHTRSLTLLFYFRSYLETPKADENIEDAQETRKSKNFKASPTLPLL